MQKPLFSQELAPSFPKCMPQSSFWCLSAGLTTHSLLLRHATLKNNDFGVKKLYQHHSFRWWSHATFLRWKWLS